LFLKFAAFYGHVWRSSFKNDDFLAFTKNEWLQGLARFNDEQVNKAIELCRENNVFPPTLPEFIGFCKQFKKIEHIYARKKEGAVLTVTAVGDTNLMTIKKMLGM